MMALIVPSALRHEPPDREPACVRPNHRRGSVGHGKQLTFGCGNVFQAAERFEVGGPTLANDADIGTVSDARYAISPRADMPSSTTA